MSTGGAVSRASLGVVRERLESALRAADPATRDALGSELFGVLHLLDREIGLRRALADPSRAGDEKAAFVRSLLAGQVSGTTAEILAEAVRQRWSRPSELADGVEALAVTAEAARVEAEGRIDDLEDELFRFSRVIEREPGLRAALADRALPVDRKQSVVETLLAGKVTASTLRLVTEVVTRPRGRSLERGLAEYARLVGERRRRLTAVVRTAVDLTEAQRTRLAAALANAYGHEVNLNIELDPSVQGGLSIRIGDEIIDGTIAGRLEDVRRRLTAS